MSVIVKHTWICDGCDLQSTHTGGGKPSEWGQVELKVINGLAYEKQFWLCGMCFNVLIRNRRTGTPWFQRLKKAIGMTKDTAG